MAIAVIAVAVAIGAWFRPAESPNSASGSPVIANDEEVADAKAALCDAHELIARATRTAASRKSDDQTVTYIVATNVRLAAAVGGQYLLQSIADNESAPSDLADDLKTLATTYQQTTLLHLADATEAELDVAYSSLDEADAKVKQACE